jgi:spore maturation protein CgeB
MREFEATMAGACYLTQATPESADLFEIGTEIECYASAAELVGKANDLLAAPERRRAMREAARKRALGEHTWQHRFTALFDCLGI